MNSRAAIRRVAIFGATSEIAVHVARRFAEAGCELVLLARNASLLEATAADLCVRGSVNVKTIAADFCRLESIREYADSAWNIFGGLDVALVAYGTLPDQKAAEGTAALSHEALDINFVSPALLAGALAMHFEQQRSGTIAVITSVAGDRGRMSNYVYGAAKGGLQRFLEGLRHRLSSAGVAVLDIRPGFVESPMTEHLERGGPLWAKPQRVAADIVDAINKKRHILYTPWFWRAIMCVIVALPRFVMHRTRL